MPIIGLQVDEVGVTITVDLGLDITTLTTPTLEIHFQKANKVSGVWPAVITTAPGTDGMVSYTTLAGDLDVPGFWKFQAVATGAGYERVGEAEAARVRDRFEL